jgi:hypothetical protein
MQCAPSMFAVQLEICSLNRDPLDLVERNLVPPPVVKLRRTRRRMIGDVLRVFERAAVLQICRYPVARNVCAPIFVLIPAAFARRCINR